MASIASLILALLVIFNTTGTISPGNPAKSTGNLNIFEKPRLDNFKKIFSSYPPARPQKRHLSFVFNSLIKNTTPECQHENARHQLTSVDYKNEADGKILTFHVVPGYDKNGNMRSFVHQYKYDYKNQLKEVVTGTGLNVEYRYDALGRRIEKIVSAPDGKVVTRYVNAGWRVKEERDDNNALLRLYT